MITIELHNNKGKIYGPVVKVNKVVEQMKHRHPNAYHLRRYMPPGWDNHIRFITPSGYFDTGHFPWLIQTLKDLGLKYEVEDLREMPEFKLVTQHGKYKLRSYQEGAVRAVLKNRVSKLKFPICGIKAATNAGKTVIAAFLHLSIKDAKTIMFINERDLFEQFKTEIPDILGKDNVGFVQGKDQNFDKPFIVAMVQTVSRNIKILKDDLKDFNVVLVDEYDLASNKTYKNCIHACYNAAVRVGLSGSAFMGKLVKHKFKHLELKKLFGEQVFEISKQDLISLGHSTPLVIKMCTGAQGPGIKGEWVEEYNEYVTYNHTRHARVYKRLQYNLIRGRIPALVVCRFREHVHELYDYFKERLGDDYKIAWVHGDVANKERKIILDNFRDGKIDILIASYIVKRGKNYPLIRYISQASGSDSPETVIQIMGRGERKHKDKRKTYLDDFFDEGVYLKRHAKHRLNYYHNEGFKVIKLYLKDGKGKKKAKRRA